MMPRDENDLIWMDGEFTAAASISAPSSAALYGKGVFTTVRIVGGKPWLFERHIQRLMRNAVALEVDVTSLKNIDIEAALIELMRRCGLDEGRARLTLFDTSAAPHWSKRSAASSSLMINAAPLRPVPRPLSLTISPFLVNSTSPLAGIKSCNYLENILALDDARSRGFNEAVRLNENRKITSVVMANVFWQRGGRLFTPALETGCLDGTTRGFILENLDVEEIIADVAELERAESIYLSSAGLGIVAADSIDGRELRTNDRTFVDLIKRLPQ